jgi:hypothetical protein
MGVKALAKAEGGRGFLILRNDGTAAVQVRLISLQPPGNGATKPLPNQPTLDPGCHECIEVTETLVEMLRNLKQTTVRV